MKQVRVYVLALCCSVWLLPIGAAELPASVQWDQRMVMGTLASGVINQVPAKTGKVVRKGDLLLALDNRALSATVSQAKAQAKYTQLLLEEAQRADDRAEELYERTVLSEYERAQSTIGLNKAQAEYNGAKATLAQARENLRQSQLRAPFDALVLQVNAQVGQAVSSISGVPELVVLAKHKSMRVQLNAGLSTARAIQQAKQLDVVVAGKRYPANAVQVSMGVVAQNANGALYAVSARFKPDTQLRAGQAATLMW